MRRRTWMIALLIPLALSLSLLPAADEKSHNTGITWKKSPPTSAAGLYTLAIE